MHALGDENIKNYSIAAESTAFGDSGTKKHKFSVPWSKETLEIEYKRDEGALMPEQIAGMTE